MKLFNLGTWKYAIAYSNVRTCKCP
jgi:hypothetical protein